MPSRILFVLLVFGLLPASAFGRLPNSEVCPSPNMSKASLYKVADYAKSVALLSRPLPCPKKGKCEWSATSHLRGGEAVLAHGLPDFEDIRQKTYYQCVYYSLRGQVFSGFLPVGILTKAKDPMAETKDWNGQWESQSKAVISILFNGVNFDLVGHAYDHLDPDSPEYLNFVGSGEVAGQLLEAAPKNLLEKCRLNFRLRGPYLIVDGNGFCDANRAKLTDVYYKVGPPKALIGKVF